MQFDVNMHFKSCEIRSAHLVCFTCNQVADGFAEEGGQKGIKGRLLLQKVVELLQKGFISTQLIIDKGHIRGQELTGNVWKPV